MLTLRLNDTRYVPTQMLSWAASQLWRGFWASHAADLARWLFQSESSVSIRFPGSVLLKARGLRHTGLFFSTRFSSMKNRRGCMENCWIMSGCDGSSV